MPIKTPIILQPTPGVYAINEYGLDTIFVVTGNYAALVIDTGMGCFDLKSCVEQLTPLPYTVVLTHGHLDHCGGWDQFDTVFLHPADFESARQTERARRIASCRRMRGLEGDADVWDYAPEQAREWQRQPALQALTDGMRFDLGGRAVTCVHTSGHSPGSCSFLDDKSRILFSGDACNVSLRITECAVETALLGLRRLSARRGAFDRNFNGHLAYVSGMNHISMPERTLDDCIHAMEGILDGTAGPSLSFRSDWADRPQVASCICGVVTVTYRPDRLREGAEPCRSMRRS